MIESFYVLGSDNEKRPIQFSTFPDGDMHCIINDAELAKNKNVLIFHRLYPDQDSRLIQLLLIIETLKEYGANEISVFVPYLPYSRQDKRYVPGEAVSSDVICRMISRAGCEKLYTLDCHFLKGESEAIRGGLKIYNLSVGDELVEAYAEALGKTEFDVVGPDSGSSYLTKNHGGKNMKKRRGDYKDLSLKDSYRDIEELLDDHIEHKHQDVLIIDDMISTGSTIIKASQRLRTKGIKNIACATTHAFFLRGSYATISQSLDMMIFYSDSIEQPNSVIKCETIFDNNILPMWKKG